MEKPVEFSSFYRVLNAAKEGEEGSSSELKSLLQTYQSPENSDGPLHHLGQVFIYVGIMELYKYAGSENIKYIGTIEKETWEELIEKNKGELPPHLANTMIKHAQNNNLAKNIATKWGKSKRDIDKHIMQMARYITEGIIDAID